MPNCLHSGLAGSEIPAAWGVGGVGEEVYNCHDAVTTRLAKRENDVSPFGVSLIKGETDHFENSDFMMGVRR